VIKLQKHRQMAKLKFDFAILPRSKSETQIIQPAKLASFGISRLSSEEPRDQFSGAKILPSIALLS
jgi:hypothetical protein